MDHKVRSRQAGRTRCRRPTQRAVALAPLFPLLASLLFGAWACAPTVTVAAPTEPIEINLNIKIEHEIRVKVDDDLENLFEDDDELF